MTVRQWQVLARALRSHELALRQALLNNSEAIAERNKHPLRPVGDYVKSRLLTLTELTAVNQELEDTVLLIQQLERKGLTSP